MVWRLATLLFFLSALQMPARDIGRDEPARQAFSVITVIRTLLQFRYK